MFLHRCPGRLRYAHRCTVLGRLPNSGPLLLRCPPDNFLFGQFPPPLCGVGLDGLHCLLTPVQLFLGAYSLLPGSSLFLGSMDTLCDLSGHIAGNMCRDFRICLLRFLCGIQAMPSRLLDFLLKLSGPAAGQCLGWGGHFLFYDRLDGRLFFNIWNNLTSRV